MNTTPARRADRERAEREALEHAVRVALQQHAVDERARIALVAVRDHDLRRRPAPPRARATSRAVGKPAPPRPRSPERSSSREHAPRGRARARARARGTRRRRGPSRAGEKSPRPMRRVTIGSGARLPTRGAARQRRAGRRARPRSRAGVRRRTQTPPVRVEHHRRAVAVAEAVGRAHRAVAGERLGDARRAAQLARGAAADPRRAAGARRGRRASARRERAAPAGAARRAVAATAAASASPSRRRSRTRTSGRAGESAPDEPRHDAPLCTTPCQSFDTCGLGPQESRAMPRASTPRELAEYFQYGAGAAGAAREPAPRLEKHADALVADFYRHLLSFPATRHAAARPRGHAAPARRRSASTCSARGPRDRRGLRRAAPAHRRGARAASASSRAGSWAPTASTCRC